MVDHRDQPGPGEQADPYRTPGEFPETVRDGSESLEAPVSHASAHLARRAALDDVRYARDSVDHDGTPRTSTERDGHETITPFSSSNERQRDHSSGGQRETALDPVQDNTGPLSDKS